MKSTRIKTIVEKRLAELVVTKSYLMTVASSALFPTGRIKIKCETSQFDLYKSSSEIELVDNAPPKLAQVIGPSLAPRSTGTIKLVYCNQKQKLEHTNRLPKHADCLRPLLQIKMLLYSSCLPRSSTMGH